MATVASVGEAARWRLNLPGWVRSIGLGNLVATVFLLGAAVWLVDEQPEAGGPAAVVLIWISVLPLLAARRHPAAAAIAVALGVLATQLLVGPLVTCGVVLPTVLAMTFQLGSRVVSTRQLVGAGVGILGACTVELALDPVLGVEAAVFIGGLATTFFLGGLTVRSQIRLAQALRQRTGELAEQREITAALAVRADRERIGSDLQHGIRTSVAAIAEATRYARVHLEQPTVLVAAFTEMELQGRETLALMRDVVGELHDAPTEPPPGIAELAGMVQRAADGGARVRLTGDVRSLSPNLELTIYRIVEQLLLTLADDVAAEGAQVEIAYGFDLVRVEVTGPGRPAHGAEQSSRLDAALTAARTRAAVLGGRLDTASSAGRRRVTVRLPTPAADRVVRA